MKVTNKILPLSPNDIASYIKTFDSEKNWINKRHDCSLCKKSSDIVCKLMIGYICDDCVLDMLSAKSSKENIKVWNYSKVQNILGPNGSISERIMALLRYRDVEKTLRNDLLNLRNLLIDNMGYINSHPLSGSVRRIASTTCIHISTNITSKPILHILLSKCKPEPWQLYSNILVVALNIAPNNIAVQKLIEIASKSENSNVRLILLNELTMLNLPWARTIVAKIKKNDLDNISPQKKSLSSKQILLKEELNKCYNLEQLRKIYENYLYLYFGPSFFNVIGSFADKKLIKGHIKKDDFVIALTLFFSEKALFETFWASIPKSLKDVMSILAWEGGEHDARRLSQNIQDPPILKQAQMYENPINDCYCILPFRKKNNYNYFRTREDYYFYFPDLLRNAIKPFLPTPKEINLIPYDEIEKTDFVYTDTDRILQQIHLLDAYIHQGELTLMKNAIKIQKTSLKQMIKYCDIKEFYDGKDSNILYLKTDIIVSILLETKLDSTKPPQVCVKKIFDDFFKTEEYKDFTLYSLFSHLKGFARFGVHYVQFEKNVKISFYNLMKSLLILKWFSVKDLIKYCKYRNIDFEFIKKNFAENYLTFDFTENIDGRNIESKKVEVISSLYEEAVTVPLFKGVMFLLASFGIVDIAYNYPKKCLEKPGDKYISLFDGLEFIRLTPLGAYIFDISKNYDAKIETTESSIHLDDTRLFIYFEGKDPIKTMILEKMADKLTDLCYKIDYKSFLKDCKSQEDVKQKIKLFKNNISNSQPPIWKKFFNDVVSKINPFEPKKDIYVYRLPENKDLISLIAKDEVLKKYILKAEDYHILIKSTDLTKVKNRLELFGYFIDNLKQ
ncbi:MAG: hypothetical protein HQK76_16775 [Desulfobacterales bacterium]|nr:hypothetical protein [Desulfobacterales bacterium]